MADFSPAPIGGSSYVPFSGYSPEDVRLSAGGPEKTFGDLLARSGGEEPLVKAGKDTVKAVKAGTASVEAQKLYEQCQALETFLMKTLLTGMRNTVQKAGLIDEGFAGKMYEDMLYDEYASSFTKNAGFGLADLAYLELSGQRGTAISRYA